MGKFDELVRDLRRLAKVYSISGNENTHECRLSAMAADAIEELQATICLWCAICSEDNRDLAKCEIYESCHAKPPKPKEET